jgi:hypothetical protein
VTPSDIGHHIHTTGNFVNLGAFYDCVCQPSHNFFGGTNLQRGILIDAPTVSALTFIDCDVETYGGGFSSNEVGFAITSSGSATQIVVENLYCEGTQVQLANVLYSSFVGITDNTTAVSGNLVGTIVGNGAVRQCKFVGCNVNVVNQSSATSYGNLWEVCNVRTTWTDNSTGPVDRRINCLFSGALVRDWGGTDPVNLTVGSSGTISGNIDCYTSNYYRIVEIAGVTAFPVYLPLHPVLGFEITIVIVNASGGVGAPPTFAGGYHMTSNTPGSPANAQESTYRFRYNGTNFMQLDTPAANVPD